MWLGEQVQAVSGKLGLAPSCNCSETQRHQRVERELREVVGIQCLWGAWLMVPPSVCDQALLQNSVCPEMRLKAGI